MDIGRLEGARKAQEIPSRIEILDENGEREERPEDWDDEAHGEWVAPYAMVYGTDSVAVRAATRRALAEVAYARVAAGVVDEPGTREVEEILMRLDARVDKAVAGLADWGGFYANRETLEFTEANVRRALEFDHILNQIEHGMRLHTDFSTARSSE